MNINIVSKCSLRISFYMSPLYLLNSSNYALKKIMRKYFYFANIDASFINENGLGLSVLKLIFGMSFQILVGIILESGKI